MIQFNSQTKHLILPVEIQNREMLAKLYFGAVAASRGYHVVVGDQKAISQNIYKLHPGIYIDKSIARTKRKYFLRLIRLGYTPVAVCEEGLVYRNKRRYIKERIDIETYALSRSFFCWGEHQKEDIKSNVPDHGKLIPTGNPRFDLLRMEFRSLWNEKKIEIAHKYGQYILINTNFSRYNRLPGTPDVVELLKKRGTFDPVEGTEYYSGLVDHLGNVMKGFISAIPRIAKRFPHHQIIIRPHPGENFGSYQHLADNFGTVHVVSDGSVVPWLLAADVIIHNSCTTGVEGWLLDRPVISYMPHVNHAFDSFLPNALSYCCRDDNELLDTIDDLISSKANSKKDEQTLEIARQYITGINGSMAADLLIENLPDTQKRINRNIALKESGYLAAKNILRKIPGLKISKGLRQLATQKFPGMQVSTAEVFLKQLIECRADLQHVYLIKGNLQNVFQLGSRQK